MPVHVIKRYANRKLYDTRRSRYVTLDEIAALIKEGVDIQIIDNKSKEDLTAVTMAQIVVEEEKREKRNGPLPALRGLIRDTSEQLSRRISDPVNTLRSNVEESVNKLIRSGEERAAVTRDQLQTWLDQNTLGLEELHRRVDERVKKVVGGLDVLTRMQRELQALEARLIEVERRLDEDRGSARKRGG